jgi:hypothetical protein
MFLKIASHLTEELLPQFKIAVEAAPTIRKWPGIETIAKQVAARGLVMSASAGAGGKEDPLLKRMKEDAEKRKSEVQPWPTN